MPTTAWSALPLCTADHVVAEAADLSQLLQVSGDAAREALITAKIGLAKDLIWLELQEQLPKRWANTGTAYSGFGSGGYGYGLGIGYTLTDLDTMLDKIHNPEVLRRAAVAKTIELTLADGWVSDRMIQNPYVETIQKLMGYWCSEYKRRISQGVNLLQFDLDQSGTIDDSERAVENNDLWIS